MKAENQLPITINDTIFNSLSEAAGYLQISRSTFSLWLANGEEDKIEKALFYMLRRYRKQKTRKEAILNQYGSVTNYLLHTSKFGHHIQ